MKPFHVYGIGNALLDIDFEVHESALERLKIEKGVMTLIDEATHHYLLEELDGIKHLKACGGSAANTLFTAQQLGAKTFYSCKVGNDEAGDFFHRDLLAHGVSTNLNECPRDGVTGKCIVLVTPDADRTMNTFLGATWHFSKIQLSEQALKNAEFLYIEGYLVASPTACDAAIIAREMANKYKIKTAITLSDPNMVSHFKQGLCDIIGAKVDLLFCNETEALLFTGSENVAEASAVLKKYADTFVITQGDQGALIYNGKDCIHIPAFLVPVVDTVGAGDVFAGTFLYGITHGYSYFDAGHLAGFAASKVVSKFGPRLTDEEIQAVSRDHLKQRKYA